MALKFNLVVSFDNVNYKGTREKAGKVKSRKAYTINDGNSL